MKKKKRLRDSHAWDVPEGYPGQSTALGRLFRKWKPWAIYILIAYGILSAGSIYLGLTAMNYAAIGLQLGMQILHIVIYFGFFFWYLAGRISVKVYYPGDINLDWDDFVGLDSIKERAQMLVSDLANPGLAKELGGIRTAHALFAGKPGTGKCVAGDTLVNCGSGIIPIGTLCSCPPQYLESINLLVDTPIGPRIATRAYNGGKTETIIIESDIGLYVECTPEHPLLIMGKGGDMLWMRADELRVDDYVGIRVGNDTPNAYCSPLGPGPDDAYAMGFLVGDGSLSNRRHCSGAITFTNIEDQIVETMRAWAQKNKLEIKPQSRKHEYAIYSKALFDKLEQWGIPACLSRHKYIPSSILSSPHNIQRQFLRGLFDADATADKRGGYIHFYTASRRLAHEVQILLLSFGIAARLYEKKNKGNWLGGEDKEFTSYELSLGGIGSSLFYEKIGFALDRKQARQKCLSEKRFDFTDIIPNQEKRIRDIIESTPRMQRAPKKINSHFRDCRDGKHNFTRASARRFLEYYSCLPLQRLVDLPIRWVKITKVAASEANVFDLTVPEGHCFIANGFVSHNTHLAKIIAAKAGVPVMVVSSGSLLGTFIGLGRLKVVELFARCFRLEHIWGGVIMVWDEIDSIGGARGGQNQTHSMWGGSPGMQVLNEVLTQLSGIADPSGWKHRLRKFLKDQLGIPYRWKHPNFLVVAATNRPDILDAALIRSGRLEQRVDFSIPTRPGLAEGIDYNLHHWKYEGGAVGVPHDDTCDPEAMAWIATGSTLADVERGINDAKRLAKFADRDYLTFQDWSTAVIERSMGLRQPMPLTERDRKGLAYHEAGHALMVKALEEWNGQEWPIPMATIVRYGGALGHIRYVPTEEHIRKEQRDLEFSLMASLGSLAAEQISGARTPGTSADLESVQTIIRLMISQGMIGNPFMIERLPQVAGSLVEKYVSKLTEAGEKLAVAYYARRVQDAIQILECNRKALDALASALVERETLLDKDIAEVLEGLVVPCELQPFVE